MSPSLEECNGKYLACHRSVYAMGVRGAVERTVGGSALR
jgi:hypothetical protein